MCSTWKCQINTFWKEVSVFHGRLFLLILAFKRMDLRRDLRFCSSEFGDPFATRRVTRARYSPYCTEKLSVYKPQLRFLVGIVGNYFAFLSREAGYHNSGPDQLEPNLSLLGVSIVSQQRDPLVPLPGALSSSTAPSIDLKLILWFLPLCLIWYWHLRRKHQFCWDTFGGLCPVRIRTWRTHDNYHLGFAQHSSLVLRLTWGCRSCSYWRRISTAIGPSSGRSPVTTVPTTLRM